jgi:hypothetical protein
MSHRHHGRWLSCREDRAGSEAADEIAGRHRCRDVATDHADTTIRLEGPLQRIFAVG